MTVQLLALEGIFELAALQQSFGHFLRRFEEFSAKVQECECIGANFQPKATTMAFVTRGQL